MTLREYRSMISDVGRWTDLEPRPGDIVISTPAKSGTTWTQTLVGLLIFDGPDFPDAMSRISPCVEFEFTGWAELKERLEAQTHRRFLKSHVPLDGMPLHPEVTYVVVGRDPRDVFLSMAEHMDNLDEPIKQRVYESLPKEEFERRLAIMPTFTSFAESLHEPLGLDHTSEHVAYVLHHLATGWALRERDNVVLLHYADLQRDLAGELARLAARLGFDYPPERIAELAAEGSIDTMRTRAHLLAPDAHQAAWKSDVGFFAAGRMDAWRDAFTPEDLTAYDARVDELAAEASYDEEFVRWAHRGRGGGAWRSGGSEGDLSPSRP